MSSPYYTDDRVTIYCGDMMEVVGEIDVELTACVTDPPYGLEFMGREWDHGVPGVSAWEAVGEVLLPGAPLLAFGGTRKWHRLAVAIEDAGFEMRDTLMWMYGGGFPKSHDLSKAIDGMKGAERDVVGYHQDGSNTSNYKVVNARGKVPIIAPATPEAQTWNGWGTALKPSWEPILLAMNPRDGIFAENALEHGVAGLNIDGCRIETDEDTSRKLGNTTESDSGWKSTNRSEIAGKGDGRWPANVVLDEQAAEMVDGQSGPCETGDTARAGRRDSESGWGMGETTEGVAYNDQAQGASRFFYTAKATKRDRNSGFADVGNDHPTVKPSDLMKWLCRLVKMPEHNHILDPFGGSGTTAYAAKELGMDCTIIEKEERYCEIAARRLRQQTLF